VIKAGTIGDDGAIAFSETHGVLVNRLIGVANLILVTDIFLSAKCGFSPPRVHISIISQSQLFF
jgi:hypothetical protein